MYLIMSLDLGMWYQLFLHLISTLVTGGHLHLYLNCCHQNYSHGHVDKSLYMLQGNKKEKAIPYFSCPNYCF